MSEIAFPASVAQVKTMADGSLRFTFDVPETAIMQAAQLMECKRWGVMLLVECIPGDLINKGNRDGTAKGNNQQSEWETPEKQGAD